MTDTNDLDTLVNAVHEFLSECDEDGYTASHVGSMAESVYESIFWKRTKGMRDVLAEIERMPT